MKRCSILLLFLLSYTSSFALNEVIYIWSGAVTPNSVKVNAKMTDTSSTIRLVLSASSQFTSPLFSQYYSVDTNTNMMVAMSVSGLLPDTRYYYAVESGGIIDSSADDVGTFITLKQGPCSFSYVTGSCCLNSDHGVYDAMGNLNPLFYSCIGDLHYANPNSATNIYPHRLAYEQQVLSKTRAARFMKRFPFEYVWDDHDFSGNDSDSSFAGKVNARVAYREYVPHYPLPAGPGDNAIYQAFSIGRVRFIHTDLRSDRLFPSMMGTVQKNWFRNECISARNNNQLICWISSVTWNGANADNWGGYTAERTELANFFRDSMINNMFIICGDAHMLAIDDGTHGDFCTNISNGALYPIFNVGALNQAGGYKGGTFSEGGYFPNPSALYGQFGLVMINDNGGSDICVEFTGYRCDSAGGNITILTSYNFCRNIGPAGITAHADAMNAITLFPNPGTGKFMLHSNEALPASGIIVTDISGRNISGIIYTWLTSSAAELNFGALPPGFYLIRIPLGDTFIEKKVILTK